MDALPDATVTFLLTDVEGSTTRWEQAPEAMAADLARHDVLIRAAILESGGHVVKTMGDAFHAVFNHPAHAVAAAIVAQRRLQAESWDTPGGLRVRMALHTGETEERDGDYYGPAMNRIARLVAIGHGGQVLLSQATADLIRARLPAGVSLLDLGAHRLKDLSQPEQVSQLVVPGLPADFPTLASLNARLHNLPVQPTPLLGREDDVAAARGLLLGGARLLTMTGPGGVGKTRLSLQVAADLVDHVEDGVFLVELAPIADPALVPTSIAQALGVRIVGERPALEVLRDHVRARSPLLVLDNFEQVLSAATVVAELLAASPGLRVLVTSREPLRLRGEREFPVLPLALPDDGGPATPEALTRYAAVRLFVERAGTIRPGFAVTPESAPSIAAICTRLDGLPLAIELAAARVRLLPPQAIAARLDHRLPLLTGGPRDLPARQQTLRDTIAWSYDLLDEGEQRLFRRLGVFVGGWTLEAAEAVCRMDETDVETLDGLESLVAKSLVQQEDSDAPDTRFRMLETIREYALDRLEASGEAFAVRRRHAEHFLALAERADPHYLRGDAGPWLIHLQAEHDNLRAMLSWSLTGGEDVHIGLRAAAALSRFWQLRSHVSEGLRWMELALQPANVSAAPARPKALMGAGWLAHNSGDIRRAAAFFEEAADLSFRLGDRRAAAFAVGDLGVITEQRGDYKRAEALLEQSLALYREVGDLEGVAARLRGLGMVACTQSDFARGVSLLQEGLALCRQLGGTFSTALASGALGLAALYQGDGERALPRFQEALTLFRQLGHTYGVAWSHCYLGRVALLRGDSGHAASLLCESLETRRDLSDTGGITGCLEGLAALALARQQPEQAARLFGAAAGLRERIDSPLAPAERVAYERDLALVRAQLDAAAFEAAWAEGSALTVEQAIDLALDTGRDASGSAS